MPTQKGAEHIAIESRQGGLVEKRTGTHKYFRTSACEICNPDLHKESLKFEYSDSDSLSPLLKMVVAGGGGGTQGTNSLELLNISKSRWHYLLPHVIIITAEYIPSKLNVEAD